VAGINVPEQPKSTGKGKTSSATDNLWITAQGLAHARGSLSDTDSRDLFSLTTADMQVFVLLIFLNL